jgi:hypothetical protein
LRQATLLVALKTKPDLLLKDLAVFEKRAVLFGKVAQLLGLKGSEKLLPLYPTLSVQERSIQESELLTFSSLSGTYNLNIYNTIFMTPTDCIVYSYKNSFSE